MGATLIKEAAKNTVKEAGDGTTTATVIAHSLLTLANNKKFAATIRPIKEGILSAKDKVIEYLDKIAIEVKGSMLENVSAISCNNDKALGKIISQAYSKVGKDGVVLMEESETADTHVDFVEGTQIECGLKSPHFMTDKDKRRAVLDNPYVLIVSSPIPNIRKIQNVLEFVIRKKRSLLIVAGVEQQPMAALLANKVKGNIKVNIIDLPGFGPTKQDTIEDLAILTGAKIIDEELGDDLDLIDPEVLGEVKQAVTDEKNTVIQTIDKENVLKERIKSVENKIKKEKNPYLKKKIQQRLAMLNGEVAIIKVGADSKVEMKEKKDRVEDAIYATKAALQEGIVPGGGVALLDASFAIIPENDGETILLEAIKAPYATIIDNAALAYYESGKTGIGIDVVANQQVNMIDSGIIDPVLVTKTALKNAVSVVNTIFSADCVINNVRVNNGSN
jgi:chaperonin GroEL